MRFRQIVYKNRKIKVFWHKLDDCWGLYEGAKLHLTLDPNQSKMNLAKTIYHELWHIICDLNEVDINKIGEEKTAYLSQEFAPILKKNRSLRKCLNELFIS